MTTIVTARTLDPCPFCGGDARIETYYIYGKAKGYIPVCNKCGCQLRTYSSKQNAIKAWNRRKQ